MTDTPNLKLPYLSPNQAQKHVTVNDSLRTLDAVVQLSVINADLNAPPVSPQESDRYIVAASATGAWTGNENNIAAWQDGAWMFYPPQRGWLVWVSDESQIYAYDGAAWLAASQSGSPGSFSINTSLDPNNRLSIQSDSILFSHDAATPGSGDMRTVLNKVDASATASFIFQTGFSGRAEIGTTGDDDFHFKVSPDGISFFEAIQLEGATGRASFPNGGVRNQLSADTVFFVSAASGDDADDGLTNGTAFATISKAIAKVVATDLGGYKATISVAAGTYTESLLLPPIIAGVCTITGDIVTPANVVLANVGAGHNITCSGLPGQWKVAGVQFTGDRVAIECNGYIMVGNVDFATSFIGMRANFGGVIEVQSGYSISASANEHIRAANGAKIIMFNKTVTLNGTPDFSSQFIQSVNGAFIRASGNTYSGAATGKRYDAQSLGGINSDDGGPAYFPGDAAGTVSSGGQYV